VREILAPAAAKLLAEQLRVDADLSSSTFYSPLLAPETFLDLTSSRHSSFADLEERLLMQRAGDDLPDTKLQALLRKGVHGMALAAPKAVGLLVPRVREWLKDINTQQLDRELTILIEVDPSTDEHTLLNHASTDLTDSRSFPQLAKATVFKEPLHLVPVDEDGVLCGPGRLQTLAALTYSVRPMPIVGVVVTTIRNNAPDVPEVAADGKHLELGPPTATAFILLPKSDSRTTKLSVAPNYVPIPHPVTRTYSCSAITFDSFQDLNNFAESNRNAQKGKLLLAPAAKLLSGDGVFTLRLTNPLLAEQIDSLYTELKAQWIFAMSTRKIRVSTQLSWELIVAAINKMNSVTSSIVSLHDDQGKSFSPGIASPAAADSKRGPPNPGPSPPPAQPAALGNRVTILVRGFPVTCHRPLILSSVRAAFPTADAIEIQASEGTLSAVCSVESQANKGIAPIIKVGALYLSVEQVPQPPPAQAPLNPMELAMCLLNPPRLTDNHAVISDPNQHGRRASPRPCHRVSPGQTTSATGVAHDP